MDVPKASGMAMLGRGMRQSWLRATSFNPCLRAALARRTIVLLMGGWVGGWVNRWVGGWVG